MADTRLDTAATRLVVKRFDQLRGALESMEGEAASQAGSVVAACGEFSGAVSDGADSFELSWREALTTCATTAALIATNTGVAELELVNLDADLAAVPDLRGPR